MLCCIGCGEPLKGDEHYCTTCGQERSLLRCGTCGNQFETQQEYCTACGTAGPSTRPDATFRGSERAGQGIPVPGRRAWRRVGWVAALAVVVASVAEAITVSVGGPHPKQVALNSPLPVVSPNAPTNTATSVTVTTSTTLATGTSPVTTLAPTTSIPSTPPITLGTNSYLVNPSLTIRSGPGGQFSQLGSVPANTTVVVQCTQPGETVTGTWGPDYWWDQVTWAGATGYITDEWVGTNADILDRNKIPLCVDASA